MDSHVIKLLLLNVVLARPTNSSSSQEHETNEDTEEDSGPSSTEEGDTKDVSTIKETSEDISYLETASTHDGYSPLFHSLDTSNEDSYYQKYSGHRPPDSKMHEQSGSYLHEQEHLDIPRRQFSTLSLDRYPSDVSTYRECQIMQPPGLSYSTLSADDLTLDARACARPRRRNKDTRIKPEDKPKLYGSLKYGNKENKEEKDQRENTVNVSDTGNIEDFIKQLVSSQLPTKPIVLFFDAAIVYEKEDYIEALNFKEETIKIVKSEYDEEIRIELFDSVAFAQSKVCVVQDVIDKCSMIFVYLTNNFRSPELKFFVEEAIGICRLELGNKDIQSGIVHNDKQWIVKPVHTAPPKMRAYRVPSGLLTVSGINWYDKHTAHTQQQIRAVVRTAYNARKHKENEAYMSGLPTSQFQLIKQDPICQTMSASHRTASAKTSSKTTDMDNSRREHVNSNTSVDAMSLTESMLQSGLLQRQQNTYPAHENVSSRVLHPPSVRTEPTGLPHDGVGQYATMNNPYGNMYSGLNTNRSFPVNTVAYNQLQTSRYPYMGPHADQYLQSPGYQHTYAPPGYLLQSASIQGRNGQFPPNGNVPNPLNAPIYPGRVRGPYEGVQGYHEQLQSGPSQGQSFMSMPSNPEYPHANSQFYERTNSGMHMHTHGNNSNNPIPWQQQNMSYHQAGRYHQNQAGVRDAYPREPGNFLLDQRNDAPPNSQLSVVSKVTGSLIVNPNLSTDDVEVDHGNLAVTSSTKSRSKNSRAKHKQSSKRYESTDSEESSSDSEYEIIKPSKGKRGKKKVVNVIGSKIVQIGRKNKVVESGNGNSQDLEKPVMLETECAHTEMRPSLFGNSPSRVSDFPADSFALQDKDGVNSTSDSNILSTDNMSVEHPPNSVNINKVLKEKIKLEKMSETDLIKSDQRAEKDHRVELSNINASDTDDLSKSKSQMNITSNDRYSRGYSQNFTSIKYHGSEVESASPDPESFNENEDSLFGSGSYDSDISHENNVKMARFTFSKAKEDSVGILKGSSPFLKARSQNVYFENDSDDID